MSETSGLPVQSDAGVTGSPRPNRLRFLTYQLTNAALNLLYPPQCIGCTKRVGSVFCQDCQHKLTPSLPIAEIDSPLLERRSTAIFGTTIRKAIHELKYSGRRAYAEVLGQRLWAELLRSNWQPTLITAIPLHSNRQRERGFNQSALLADYLSLRTGILCAVNAVRRVRETKPQVGLDSHDRQQNVAGAFEADARIVKGHTIVVIDDVFTTGATVRACARALLDAGASKVWALTVASAGAKHFDQPNMDV
jgi:competence protein ComFC